MGGSYRVRSTATFDRQVRKLTQRNLRIREALIEAAALLQTDPYDLSDRADIRKLVGIPAGEGRFRLRLGEYRLRYDVIGDDVILHSLRHRKESYR